MLTVTPSACVTGRHTSDPNSALCVIADREMPDLHMHRWFSGRILAFHAGAGFDFPDDADSIYALTPRKIRATCKHFDVACYRFKIFIYTVVCR